MVCFVCHWRVMVCISTDIPVFLLFVWEIPATAKDCISDIRRAVLSDDIFYQSFKTTITRRNTLRAHDSHVFHKNRGLIYNCLIYCMNIKLMKKYSLYRKHIVWNFVCIYIGSYILLVRSWFFGVLLLFDRVISL